MCYTNSTIYVGVAPYGCYVFTSECAQVTFQLTPGSVWWPACVCIVNIKYTPNFKTTGGAWLIKSNTENQ